MQTTIITLPHPTPHTHTVPLLEIARLENSLQHLRRTQDELRSYSDDPELSQYLRENEAVMFVCPLSLSRFSSSDPSFHFFLTIDPTLVVLWIL
jgi:hypothetical protein